MTTIFGTIKLQQEVYRDGMAAFEDELTLDDCPYSKGDTLEILWTTGWESANDLARVARKVP